MLKYIPLLAIFLLFACTDDKGKKPLEGERIPIILETQSLQADFTLREKPVTIAPAKNLDSWQQSYASASHNLGNVSYSLAFEEAWTQSIGSTGELPDSAIAAGGLVFAMDAKYQLNALNGQDGSIKWKTNLAEGKDSAFGGGIALYRGKIFASDGFGTISAVSAENGNIIWTQNLLTPIRSTPAVESDIVIVTSIDNQAVAFNANDGSILWKHQGFQENVAVVGTGSPAIIGNLAIVPYSSGELYGLRITDGSVLWQANISAVSRSSSLSELGDISADPVIDEDGFIYAISNGGRLSALDIRNGETIWEHRLSGGETPIVSGDYLFVVSNSSQLLAIRKTDGAVHWQKQLPNWEDAEKRTTLLDWKGPLLLSGKLFLVNGKGEAVLVDSQTGEIIEEMQFSEGLAGSPVIANGIVYLLHQNAKLSAYK